MEPEISKEKMTEQMLEVVRRSKLEDAGIMLVATWGAYTTTIIRGMKKLGGAEHKVSLQIHVFPYRWAYPREYIEGGIRIMIPSIRAYPIQCLNPRIKNFDRLHFYLAQLEALNAGADAFVCLTINGHLSEGFNANIWLIKNSKLFTPSENSLKGITSDCVFDLAREMNVEATSTFLTAWDLYTADEAFFCTSAGGITPIVEVDARTIGNGNPGPLTRRLIDVYWKMHVDPKYAVRVY
jgi:branched-chain amino acid aminotransferase